MDGGCGRDRAAVERSVWVNTAAPWKGDHGSWILLRGEWDPRALRPMDMGRSRRKEHSHAP